VLVLGAGEAHAQSRKMQPRKVKSARTDRNSRERTTTVRKKKEPAASQYFGVGIGMVEHGGGSGQSSMSDFAIQPTIGFHMSKQLSLELSILGVFANSPDQTNLNDPSNPSNTGTSGNQGLTLGGIGGAAKWVLPVDKRFLPYGLFGLGAYTLGSEQGDFRPAVDFGMGTDYRVNRDVSVGARWVYTGYWLDNAASSSDPDSSWAMMATASMRF
jgi:hypothetical protein